jgi:hypothetical protein
MLLDFKEICRYSHLKDERALVRVKFIIPVTGKLPLRIYFFD